MSNGKKGAEQELERLSEAWRLASEAVWAAQLALLRARNAFEADKASQELELAELAAANVREALRLRLIAPGR